MPTLTDPDIMDYVTRHGFTATRDLINPNAHERIWVEQRLHLIAPFHDGTGLEFTTGGCVGGDALIGRALIRLYPHANHRVVLPANRSQVQEWWLEPFMKTWIENFMPGTFEIIEMPEGTTYKQRNEMIVFHSDQLMAFASYPEAHGKSTRSGTWQTIRIGRSKLGRDNVTEYVLHEQ